jgi:two-component system chemotaxis response regulator CheY
MKSINFTGKILLVDDEVHIRKYVSLILKQLGRPVICEAGDGEEALIAYQANKPDFVLLDVSMPRMDGLETLQKLMKLDPECAVIMLTSLANRETVERALEYGAVSYIRKDTPKEEILKALAEAITACSNRG